MVLANEVVERFIQEQRDLIDANDFDAVYNVFYMQYALFDTDIGELSDVFIEAGINPLVNKTYVIPGMFYRSEQEEIILPDTIVEIRAEAFAYMPNLKRVVIPKTVKKIGVRAFASIPTDFVMISYEGTSEQWDAIDKKTTWDFESNIKMNFLED